MLAFILNSLQPFRLLNDIDRDAHEARREATNLSLAERRENDLPAFEAPDAPDALDTADVEAFEADRRIDGIGGQVRNLSSMVVAEAMRAMMTAYTRPDADAETQQRLFDDRRRVARAFVKQAWANVEGIEGPDGPLVIGKDGAWSEADLDMLESAGLLLNFWRSAHGMLGLDGEERGNCGASQPTSSESAPATPAHDTSAKPTGASDQASPGGLRAKSTKATDAPVPFSERTQPLVMSSGSTSTAKAG